MGDAMIEHGIEKVSIPPIVHDATHPDAGDDDHAGPKTGALVALVGTPSDGDVAVYDAALGYFVPVAPAALPTGTPVTVSDGMGGFELLFDGSGNVVYT
jgi:hypothetical protein